MGVLYLQGMRSANILRRYCFQCAGKLYSDHNPSSFNFLLMAYSFRLTTDKFATISYEFPMRMARQLLSRWLFETQHLQLFKWKLSCCVVICQGKECSCEGENELNNFVSKQLHYGARLNSLRRAFFLSSDSSPCLIRIEMTDDDSLVNQWVGLGIKCENR